MTRRVRRARLKACTSASRRFDSNTASALVFARSVAEPIATLMSAAASTGTSLTPSPSINTCRPSLCSCCKTCNLSSGRKPPRASSMPSSAATLATIGELSPDSSNVRQPRALHAASSAGASLRKRSSRTNHASGPWSLPSSNHWPASSGMTGTAAPLSSQTNPGWPIRKRCSPTHPSRPRPGVLWTSSAASGARPNARAIGCSERFSRAAARLRHWSLSSAPSGRIERSARRPSVRVPVLSKITVSIWFRPSSTWPRVNNRPSLCKVPVAAVRAVGVARDKAHGQVATSIASTIQNARDESSSHQTRPMTAAAISDSSRNHCAARSAICASRGFSAWARSSRRTMADNRVSWPRARTCTVNAPSTFRVPAVTASPGILDCGRYSPVSRDSSMLDWPSRILPSAGRIAPGCTST
ncbi:hypothetical protein PS639_04069 [Pseudomonas fluorescens]|nr:hypothetical protein PS639_04069 [Pseudomonas fluorescens]